MTLRMRDDGLSPNCESFEEKKARTEADIRKDEQMRIGKALRKFYDERGLDISFLNALSEIIELAKGKIPPKEGRNSDKDQTVNSRRIIVFSKLTREQADELTKDVINFFEINSRRRFAVLTFSILGKVT